MVGLWKAIRQDWSVFCHRWRAAPPFATGLYTYRLRSMGRHARIHLRIEPDGAGVLMVDVTDIVHLNPSAAEIAKWALDGVHPRTSLGWLQARHGHLSTRMRQDVASVCAMVDRFRQPDLGCPTCALEDVRRVGLFATPVRAPFKADLAITYECNNDCPHCYNEVDRLSLKSLAIDQWQQIIDRLVTVGIPHLIFTGGEATLSPDLPLLIDHADRQGPICGLNSNGRRMAHRSYTQELATAGLNHVQITLGSHQAETHDRMMHARSFDQTIRGIRNALDAGLHTITNTTLMRMNVAEISQTIAFLHSLGIRTFAMNGLIYAGGGVQTPMAIAEQELSAILVRIRDVADRLGMRFLWYTPTQYCRLSPVELEVGAKRCNAGEYSICVEPNGDVLPCQSYYVTAGNMLDDHWRDLWQGKLFRSFRDRVLDPPHSGLPEKCWECPDLPVCGGGCRIEREAAQGQCGGGACGTCSVGDEVTSHLRGFVTTADLVSDAARRARGLF